MNGDNVANEPFGQAKLVTPEKVVPPVASPVTTQEVEAADDLPENEISILLYPVVEITKSKYLPAELAYETAWPVTPAK